MAAETRNDDAGDSLPNVLVTEKQQSQLRQGQLSSAKIALPAEDLPFSAEIIDASVLAAGFTDLGNALQVASMASISPSEGGAFDQITLRGFVDTAFYRNGINDSLGQMPMRSLANIERVEVLKGPSGALYGPAGPGGTINVYTKKPQPDARHSIALSLGSYSEFKLDLDSTGPLAARPDLLYRIVAAREQGDTFRDFVKNDRIFIAPSLTWQASRRLVFEGSFEYLRDDRLLDPGIPAVDNEFPLPGERFLGEPGSRPAQIDGLTLQLSAQYEINPAWQLDLSVHGQKTLLKGEVAEPVELDDQLLLRERKNASEKAKVIVAQLEANGQRVFAGRRHHLLVGIEGTILDEDATIFTSDADDEPFAIDIFNPLYGTPQPLVLEAERDSHEERRQVSVYAQDLWELTERWRVLVALRFDHIAQKGFDTVANTRFSSNVDKLSPRLGLVFKPTDSLSWFASYSKSIDPNEGLQLDGAPPLKPTEAESVETGFKWQNSTQRVSFNTSIFYIEQTNITTEAPDNPSFEIQRARQENLGVDFELRSEHLRWLTLTAKYSYIDTQIKDDPVIMHGTRALNVEKHKFSVLGLTQFSVIEQNDLAVGVALAYTSNRQGSLEEDELELTLPGYFRADLFASFDYREHVQLQLQVRNFTDETYLQGSQSDALRITPGPPISIHAQIKYAF